MHSHLKLAAIATVAAAGPAAHGHIPKAMFGLTAT